ncbi:MAG: S8 family serine peptidase [bacterium]|jgi:bacillopeptidase F|nr:S8 family serine peptidase [bacterium]
MAAYSRLAARIVMTVLALCLSVSASLAEPIDARLETVLDAAGEDEETAVIVRFKKRVDVRRYRSRNRHVRRFRLVRELRRKAAADSLDVKRLLRKTRKAKSLWLIEGLALTARSDVIREIALHPRVERILLDEKLSLALGEGGEPGVAEWNIDLVGAPELWDLGHRGAGVVVASMDSGVDKGHPDLVDAWRGEVGGWYDPHGQHAEPYDKHGHGTWTMGIMLGGSAGGSAIGVAPDAEWIAAKIFNDQGESSYSAIHLSFQWLLDPDGDSSTDDAPDLVNGSWGMGDYPGQCLYDFEEDITALTQADITVIFAAGNSGPDVGTSVSPANYTSTFSVGSINDQMLVAPTSSRGPSACGGALFPDVVAPGVNIRTSDRDLGQNNPYASTSGTSFAAPHATGLVALLKSAFPTVSSPDLVLALQNSAIDLGPGGAENDYGAGMINAVAAYDRLITVDGECPAGETDTDADGLPDSCDNCTLVPNPPQRDTDDDGFGNICDADFNDDGVVNFGDVGSFVSVFGTTDPDADFNGDGVVNFGDVSILLMAFGLPPGP